MTPAYLLDSNVFIDAKNQYYAFDIFPVFWKWLDTELVTCRLGSVTVVRDELLRGTDPLAQWIRARRNLGCFVAVDDKLTQQKFSQIASWIMNQSYKPEAKSDFLACGDPWLITKAHVIGATVVTDETLEPNRLNKVKIPNVCQAFNVPCLNTFDALRRLGVIF